jgi:hypothetical protein
MDGEKCLRKAGSAFCTMMILLVLLVPFVRSEQTGTSRALGIKPQLERKDTYMLNLQYPLTGPYAWDIPHENRSSQDSDRCIKAAVSTIASYYGGHLSQDRIAYYVYHEVLNWTSPEDDLGNPSEGIVDLNIVDLLNWALSGAIVNRIMGKPDFSSIEYWIDSGIPIVRDAGGDSHLITIIDGYDTNGQMVYVIDPLTGNETMVPYDSLNIFVAWIVYGDHITARSDEPTIWTDSDGDGVVDFDEINRFHTDPYNNDTYGLGLNDKRMIELIYVDHVTIPMASFEHSPQSPFVNDQVTFNASGSNGNITAYRWDFEDNNITTVTEPVISHTYSQPGNYNVSLRVTDSNGLWNITTSLMTVNRETTPDKYGVLFLASGIIVAVLATFGLVEISKRRRARRTRRKAPVQKKGNVERVALGTSLRCLHLLLSIFRMLGHYLAYILLHTRARRPRGASQRLWIQTNRDEVERGYRRQRRSRPLRPNRTRRALRTTLPTTACA